MINWLKKSDDKEERSTPHEYAQNLKWCPFATITKEKMKTKGKYKLGYPEGAVIHYTAGTNNPMNTLAWGREQGYCYFLIDREGEVYQSFPLDEWGYHAGESSWLGRDGVSKFMVGIELIAAGKLVEVPPKQTGEETKFAAWYHFLSGTRTLKKDVSLFSRDEVRVSRNECNIKAGVYQKFTAKQEESLINLLKWLRQNNPKVFSFANVVGHDEVAPSRKDDPGGALSRNMPNFRSMLLSDTIIS